MKTKRWGPIFGLILLSVAIAMSGGCKKKKGSLFWLPSDGVIVDANGVPLPEDIPAAEQEVPTHGPAQISGSIHTFSGVDEDGHRKEADDICGMPAAPPPPNCLDYTTILVQLVDPNGDVIATTHPDSDGDFQFDIDDLYNNNYRVLIETGGGLNYAYADINFVHDPTAAGGVTIVDAGEIAAERLIYARGPALISGNVQTPGFDDGTVNVASGGRAGITVELRDSDGNLIAQTTTNASGDYSFDLQDLPNGNYTVTALGSQFTESGRPFTDSSQFFQFSFQGNDNTVATDVTIPRLITQWDAATQSALAVSGTLTNAAVVDTTTQFTVQLVNAAGDVLATTTVTGSGSYSLSASSLPAGVYTVQAYAGSASNPITFPASSTVVFQPDPTGGTRTITGIGVNIVAKPSKVVGYIQAGSLSYVPGSVINFRPASTQPPVNLLYLLQDDRIRASILIWLAESNTSVATNCVASGNLTPACVLTNQGSGPWNYATYSNKVYEVRPDNSVYFQAVAGKWAYYISAPGYENWCDSNSSNCATNPLVITLNGQDYDAGSVNLTPSGNRSQIAGSITVQDRLLLNNTTTGQVVATPANRSYSGMMVVLLGNTDNNGNPVAHVAATLNGSYSFGGDSYVVPLPAGLTTDEQRVGYALGEVAKLAASQPSQAQLLANASSVVGGATASVHVVNGNEFHFRQSSYQAIVVDPLGHTQAASFSVNTTGTATNTYLTTPVIHNQSNTISHLPRRQIVGNIFNAISAAGLGTATVLIGRPGPDGEFVPDVRRDCNGGLSNDYNCPVSSVRQTPGEHDQTLVGPTTEANGFFRINNIDPGDYILRISADGFQTADIGVSVPSTGAIPNITVPLVPNVGSGNLAGNVRLPGGHPFTGTYNLEIVHPISGNRPVSGVQPASLTSGFTTFSNAPSYNIFQLSAGQWKLRFVSAGYTTVEGLVNIQANTTTQFDIITMVPGSDPPASIVGRAINAYTNNASGMGGLTVRIRPGVNVTSGPFATFQDGVTTIPAVTTAANGSFAINNVPAGNYTLEVSGPGVLTTYRTVISAGTSTPASQNVLVSPTLGADEVRIILSWNATPRDLDSHLEYGSAKPAQVVWNDRNKLGGDATLDVDVVTGYGPETVTLKGSVWNQSRRGYSVFNWSNESSLVRSGAVVRVFNRNGLMRTYAVPSNTSGRWWRIFCLTPNRSLVDVGTDSYCQHSHFFNAPMN